MPVTAQAIASIGSTVATTIAQVKDVKKRRDIEMAISRLSYDDQRKLNEKMARAKNDNEKLAILVEQVNAYNIASMKEQSTKDTRNALIVIGSAIVLLVAVVILKRRN